MFERVDWAWSGNEVGKASKWLFGILKKAGSATIEKFFDNRLECKKEHLCNSGREQLVYTPSWKKLWLSSPSSKCCKSMGEVEAYQKNFAAYRLSNVYYCKERLH
jgi:hypothetical protein